MDSCSNNKDYHSELTGMGLCQVYSVFSLGWVLGRSVHEHAAHNPLLKAFPIGYITQLITTEEEGAEAECRRARAALSGLNKAYFNSF